MLIERRSKSQIEKSQMYVVRSIRDVFVATAEELDGETGFRHGSKFYPIDKIDEVHLIYGSFGWEDSIPDLRGNSSATNPSRLLDFYREKANIEFYYGLSMSLSEILTQSDAWWESQHDFIQWLFPTKRASDFNADAPVLTSSVISEWKIDQTLRGNFLRAFRRWLSYMGLAQRSNGSISFALAGDLTQEQILRWGKFNHNFLRITRVLDCLTTLGFVEESKALYAVLSDYHDTNPDIVSDHCFSYWAAAVNGENFDERKV